MSASLSIEANDSLNGLSESIDNLVLEADGPVVKKAMGAALRKSIVDHFMELESDSLHHRTADRLGAEHSGFFADAARATQVAQIEPEGVSVSINKLGLRLRYYGGTVTPGKSASWKSGRATQWLSIPNDAAAYGTRTQEWDHSAMGIGNLRFVYFRPDLAALVERLATNVKRVRGIYKPVSSTIGKVIFWLKKSATYKADSTVLPTNEQMLNAAIEAGETAVANIWDAQFGGTRFAKS